MSFDKNEELFDFEIIYRSDDNQQKIFYEEKEKIIHLKWFIGQMIIKMKKRKS